MTKFISKLNELEEARKLATEGEWEIHVMPDEETIWTNCDCSNPVTIQDLNFIDLSANSMLPLIQAAREMYETIKDNCICGNPWEMKCPFCKTLYKLESIFEKEK